MGTDLERLQSTIDEIAGTVEWAAGWLEHLEEGGSMRTPTGRSSPPRWNGCGWLPTRSSRGASGITRPGDAGTWPRNDVRQREVDLGNALDAADRRVAQVAAETEAQREKAELTERKRDVERREHDAERAARNEVVAAYLREHGPSTVKKIAAGTGLVEVVAEVAARSAGAKRGRDRRFRLDE